MSKHFKTSLTRDPHGRMARLKGEPTGDIETIKTAYEHSDFYYQFADDYGQSKVMRCRDDEELKFVIDEVKWGAKIIIQSNPAPRPVYHYDPAFRAQPQPAL